MLPFSIPTMSMIFLNWSSSLSPLNKVLPVTIKWKMHPSAHTSTSAPYLFAPSSNSGARQCSDPTIFVIDFCEKSSSFAIPRSMILRWQLLASISAGSGCDCVCVFLGASMILEGFKSRWIMSRAWNSSAPFTASPNSYLIANFFLLWTILSRFVLSHSITIIGSSSFTKVSITLGTCSPPRTSQKQRSRTKLGGRPTLLSVLNLFTATVSLVVLSRARQTTPQAPSYTRYMMVQRSRKADSCINYPAIINYQSDYNHPHYYTFPKKYTTPKIHVQNKNSHWVRSSFFHVESEGSPGVES